MCLVLRYEVSKVGLQHYWASPKDPGPSVRFFSGFIAGFCSVTATYPLDLVRTKLAANQNPNSASYTLGPIGVIRECYKDGGILSLYNHRI